jgi:hypothetical protein
LWALVLVTALAALAVVAVDRGGSRENGRSRSASPRSSWIVHENEAGRYSFMSPRTWRVTNNGSVSQVKNPSRDVVVSFGHRARGTELLRTARRLTTLLDRTYRGVRLRSPTLEAIGGHLTVMRRGRTTNDVGEKLRVLVAAIRGPARIYGVVAFEAATTRPTDDVIVDIVRSFRVQH